MVLMPRLFVQQCRVQVRPLPSPMHFFLQTQRAPFLVVQTLV